MCGGERERASKLRVGAGRRAEGASTRNKPPPLGIPRLLAVPRFLHYIFVVVSFFGIKEGFSKWVVFNFKGCNLLILVGSHSYELGLGKAVAGDHALRAPNSHDVNPRFILMQGV